MFIKIQSKKTVNKRKEKQTKKDTAIINSRRNKKFEEEIYCIVPLSRVFTML